MAVEIKVGGQTIWSAFPAQERALARTEQEILYGGARGGGKTACGMVWLLMGNSEPTGTVADGGYYQHPHYRALVLRKNVSDMGDWLAKARLLYGQLGAKPTDRPMEFTFPSGAVIVVGHLDDKDAYEKYQGQEFTRILIEELTQIPTAELYLKVRASNRSPFDELHPQIFLTANPGGPGHGWVRERFIEPVKPGEVYTDPIEGNTRIFIPAKIQDNPIYAEDKQYVGQLMGLPPATRRAWLEGDWDAIAGEYFEEFRATHRLGEPPHACHVVLSHQVKLEPWYYRWLSCDWGYAHNSAIYKACLLPNGQIHVYDELVMNKTTPEDLGVEIAKFIWPEIYDGAATQKGFTLFLSHEQFGRRTEERTGADQIAAGIAKVFGPNSSLVIYDEAAEALPNAVLQRNASVAVRRAPNQRIAGWMYVKSLMRWWPLLGPETPGFDAAYALKLFAEDRLKWRQYCDLFKREEEVLPKLQIHGDKCPKLVRAIPSARSNDPDKGDPEDVIKTHWDGADCMDSLRYLLFGAKFLRVQEPWEVFYAKHLERHVPGGLASLPAGSAVWIARKAEADYKKLTETSSKPIHFTTSRAKAARFRSRAAAKRP
jgi:hypothetical protein